MASPRLETLKREVAKICSSQTLGRSKVQSFIAAVRETHEEWLTQGVETRWFSPYVFYFSPIF